MSQINNESGRTRSRFVRKSALISIGVFVILILALIVSIHLSSRPPHIVRIEPKIGLPGDILSIQGNHFGESRERSRVLLSDREPIVSEYLSWTDEEIQIQIPVDLPSGLVYVETEKGKSNGILFTNRNKVPHSKERKRNKGAPVLSTVNQEEVQVGDLLKLSGRRFGLFRDGSRVYFETAFDRTDLVSEGSSPLERIVVTEEPSGYEYWSEMEIEVRVPDGALSGWVYVETEKGRSERLPISVSTRIGRKLYINKVSYAVNQRIDITAFEAERSEESITGDVFIWMPYLSSSPEQRNIQVLRREPEPRYENCKYHSLFSYHNPQIVDRPLTMEQVYLFDRYEIESRVIASRVDQNYDEQSQIFKKYTKADSFVPAFDETVAALGADIGRRGNNPLLKARLVYDYIIKSMEPAGEENYTGVIEGLEQKTGGALTYASLFTALMRSQKIPSRVLSGFLILEDGSSRCHFWAEFYLSGFGWYPVDPYLGDTDIKLPSHFSEDSREEISRYEYYFGNIDNRHISFSSGLTDIPQLNPDAQTVRPGTLYSLQTVYGESSPESLNVETFWHKIVLLSASF